MELRSLPVHLSRRIEWPQAMLAGLIVVMLVVGAAWTDRFASGSNLGNVVEQSTTLGLVTLGQMLVVLTGGIDLSVGAVISLGSILLAGSVDGSEALLWPMACAVLGLGALVGLVNGLVIVRLKVNPLIMTLGMASILYGAALLYRRQPGGAVPVFFTEASYAKLAGVPLSGLLLLLIYALAFVFLNYTRLGRRLYAVGSDVHAAHLSGIAISRVLCFAYATSGFLAALAGVYLTSRSGVGDPRAGVGFDLASITPVVIGGTLLRGGRGGVVGTLLAVWLLSLLNNLLNFLDVSTYYQWMAQGVILIAAVSFFSGAGERSVR